MDYQDIPQTFVSRLVKDTRNSFNIFKHDLNELGLSDLPENLLKESTSVIHEEVSRLQHGNYKEYVKACSFASFLMQYKTIESGRVVYTKRELRQITDDFIEYLNQRRF